MGRKARAFPVTGYVIGPDYQLNRDALIYALEREGPGQLILPTMGELTAEMVVQPLTYGVRERRTAGGMAEFEMSFVEAGEAGFDSLVDTQGQSDMASDNAERTATDTSNKDLAEGSGGGGSTTPVLT
jgi:prophage DNA circulation protein